VAEVRRAIGIARAFRPRLTRYERYSVCHQTAEALRARTEEIANLITAESGLCKKTPSMRWAARAMCSSSPATPRCRMMDRSSPAISPRTAAPQGLYLAGAAPGGDCRDYPVQPSLNQVAHKVAPSIASNNRMVLKPSEKTPLSALLLADILYEAGLPPEMFSVLTGDPRESPMSC